MNNEERKHPQTGKAIELTAGPNKGKYFVVINYLTTQFQGKDINKIAKAHPNMDGIRDLTNRKLLDADAVYGRLYPSMDFFVVHESDLLVKEEEQPKKKLKLVKGEQDDTGETTGTDTAGDSTGDSEPAGSEGRADSADEEMEPVASPYTEPTDSTGPSSGGDSGPKKKPDGDTKSKAKNGTGKARSRSQK